MHLEYLAAHPDDQPPLDDFKQAINLVYPTLGGFPPRSLRRKGMPGPSQPNAVRPVTQNLDGADEADSASRPDMGDEGAEKSIKKHDSAVQQTKDEVATFRIYEDGQPQTASLPEEAGHRQSQTERAATDDARRTHPPANRHLPKQATPQLANVRSTPKDRSTGIRQHDHDTQDTDHTQSQPLSAFQDFAYAWKQLKPGGAFAKHRSSRPQVTRKVDILAWSL